MYTHQTEAEAPGHIITPEEWNAQWNLSITEADHTSKAVNDIRDMLYETVLADLNGALAVTFADPDFTATDVSAALIELNANDDAMTLDYISRDSAMTSDYNGKFVIANNNIAAAVTALTNHKTSSDHDGRYYTETETANMLALKADLASPTFTGTVSGITKAMVGLGAVDNTSDANKPISVAQQGLFDLKASIAQLNAHKTSADHDGRYAFLANETPFTPVDQYNLVTKLCMEQKISEAVLSGISDNSITDAKMAVGNKKADIVAAAVAEALPLIPPAPFDFDTPVGKAGWAYSVTGTGPVTEAYKLGAVTKCSRVTSFDTPSAGKTRIVTTAPDGIITTQIYNADGSADPITEV